MAGPHSHDDESAREPTPVARGRIVRAPRPKSLLRSPSSTNGHPHDDGGRHGHAHADREHEHGHDHHDHDHNGHAGHEHAHGHAHDFRGVAEKALWVSLGLNGAFLVLELVVGWMSGSLALLSDGFHLLTDVAALGVALAASRLRARPRGGRSTFGLERLPVVGGLFNGLLSLMVATGIVVEAIERLRAPPAVMGLPVLVVAAVGLVVNLASAWWLHKSGDHGVNTRGALVHMLGDAAGSLAALVSGIVLMTTSFTWADPIASLLVAGIVAASALPLLRDAVSILLERAPAHIDIAAVSATVRAHGESHDVVGLHVWELDSGVSVASIVVATDEHDLAHLAKTADHLRGELLAQFGIRHVTVEWRPLGNAQPCCT